MDGYHHPYTPAGGADLAEWRNGPAGSREARRWLRRFRRDLAQETGQPMRITIEVWQPARARAGDELVDCCEVFGWRAALTAIRALRAEHTDPRWGKPPHGTRFVAFDDREWRAVTAGMDLDADDRGAL